MNAPAEFFHVLGTLGDGKPQVLFSDPNRRDLDSRFVRPYKKRATFFAGNELISPKELRAVQIIRSASPEAATRQRLNKEDLARIDEINSLGAGLVIIGIGANAHCEHCE